jgi:hypothetical protein
LSILGGLDGRGVKADLGVLLDVEEVRRLQMRIAVLVTGVDAGHLDGAGEHGGIAGGVNRALESTESAPHGGDSHVLDLEADAGMAGINGVSAAGDLGGGDGG